MCAAVADKQDEANQRAECERCGAAATEFVCFVVGGSDAPPESHAYCKACAKAAGEYPPILARVMAYLMFLAFLPFRGYLRRKYPPSYWESKRKEWEAQHGTNTGPD